MCRRRLSTAGAVAAAAMAIVPYSTAHALGRAANIRAQTGQALRVCIDRWNQGRMLSWGPTLAFVSARPRCTVSLAVHYVRKAATGCVKGAPLPTYAGFCVDRSVVYICVINRFGGYVCPSNADTAGRALKLRNASTDTRGHLTPDTPLRGTHGTPPLQWQRRYPHVDGWILPWAEDGRLRNGLQFRARERGDCFRASQQTATRSAVRCASGPRSTDPCFPRAAPLRPGDIVACPNAPGDTSFTRFVVSG